MSKIKVYGISGCTTVKRSKEFLEKNNADFDYLHFHKVEDLGSEIKFWFEKAGKDKVLNQAGRNYKQLDENLRKSMQADDDVAIREMVQLPQLIKRPMAVKGDLVLTGFKEEQWNELI
ncbi:MAG: ArsC/Spx/MgsR family protein [Bacteroidota bacterium]